MPLHADYISVIEKRLEWLKWAQGPGSRVWGALDFTDALPLFTCNLENANATTYYMDPQFCHLVDHSRRCAPDNLEFQLNWLQSPSGWLYVAEPFKVPEPRTGPSICAGGVLSHASPCPPYPLGADEATNSRPVC